MTALPSPSTGDLFVKYQQPEFSVYTPPQDNKISFSFQLSKRLTHNTVKPLGYQLPYLLNTFSVDTNLTSICNNSQLRYYIEPPLNIDLNIGADIFIRKPEFYKPGLDGILLSLKQRYYNNIKLNRKEQNFKDVQSYRSSIFAWRGLLSKMAVAPYSKDDWAFVACKVGNAILLDELLTVAELNNKIKIQSTTFQRMCYWGYKFEQYCTTPDLKAALNGKRSMDLGNEAVNSCEAFCCVIKSKLGEHLLVMGAETDCSLPIQNLVEGDMSNFIELKTSRVFQNINDKDIFERHKLLKIWAQSYLAGVPLVVVGFRDEKGIVKNVIKYKTLEIPKLLKLDNTKGLWESNVCLNFLNNLFDFIKSSVSLQYNEAAYIFRYDPIMHRVTVEIDHSNTRNFFANAYVSFADELEL